MSHAHPVPRFCPRCAAPLVSRDAGGRARPACPDAACGFVHWNNPTPVVAAIVEHDGAVLLARVKPAGKGAMDGAAWARGARLQPGARCG